MSAVKPTAFNLQDYIRIARPAHWVKHVFIIPGTLLAYLLTGADVPNFPWSIVLGFVSAALLSSANYVINEWLDAEFDKFHPVKKSRPAANQKLIYKYVVTEYLLLAGLGLFLAYHICLPFFLTAAFFLFMAFLYNVEPLRFKDRPFWDVLSESVNNPIRLILGWTMVSQTTIPPISLIILYWFGGAFLMAAKRLAEYRYLTHIGHQENLFRYRKTFQLYTENSLLVSSFLYGLLSSFFIAAFLIKHRNEFLFVFPLFAWLFSYYLSIALKNKSAAQAPEKLYRDKKLLFIGVALTLALTLLTFVNIPIAQKIVGLDKGVNYRPW